MTVDRDALQARLISVGTPKKLAAAIAVDLSDMSDGVAALTAHLNTIIDSSDPETVRTALIDLEVEAGIHIPWHGRSMAKRARRLRKLQKRGHWPVRATDVAKSHDE